MSVCTHSSASGLWSPLAETRLTRPCPQRQFGERLAALLSPYASRREYRHLKFYELRDNPHLGVAVIELVELRAAGTWTPKPLTETPWQWWFNKTDVSEKSRELLSRRFNMMFE